MLSKVPTPLEVNKSKSGQAIRIPALSKATRPFFVEASQIDQYFCADFEEPNGWEIVDKNEMETLHRIFEAKHTWMQELSTPVSSIVGRTEPEINKSSS